MKKKVENFRLKEINQMINNHICEIGNIRNKSGIYIIYVENENITYIYVGQTNDLGERRSKQFSVLRTQKSIYSILQEAYNRNNEDIRFEVVEFVDESELHNKEEQWYYLYKDDINYNLLNKIKRFKTISIDGKRKISEAKKGKKRKLSEENVDNKE